MYGKVSDETFSKIVENSAFSAKLISAILIFPFFGKVSFLVSDFGEQYFLSGGNSTLLKSEQESEQFFVLVMLD
jgi:hypothetical protein